MQQSAPSRRATLRSLRILHGTLIVAILLYLCLMSIVSTSIPEPMNPALPWILGAIAVYNLGLGQWMRSKRLRPAFEILRNISDDPKALAGWRQGVIIGDSLAMAVVLYGLVIHFLGGTALQVAPFFVVGTAAMLLWWPREPES